VKNNSLSNLQQRVITGLLGALLMVTGMVYSAWSFGILFFLITILATHEFYKLVRLDGNNPLHWLGTIVSGMVFMGTYWVASGSLETKYLTLIFPLLSLVFLIKLYKKEQKPFVNIAFTFLGIIYVAFPLSLLNFIAFENQVFNYQIVSGCLFLLWGSDTGAYFAGTTLGKKKLFERISPKKSWEGLFGGFILSLIVAFVLSYFYVSIPLWKWVVLSLLIVICGTYGDLVESLFKRSLNVKDSGTLLPGHGGLLDRFDGLLLSSPFLATFMVLTQ